MKKFDCKCCGDCCSGSMEIRLNIYDIYKIAKHLNIKHSKQLFTEGYLSLVKGQNGITFPKIKFKKNPYPFCPFLINDLNEKMELKGYCSLHPYIKPLVCILAPISKEYNTETSLNKYDFIKPTVDCPGELVGEDIPINEILQPIKRELEYEGDFYNLLNIIINKDIKNYIENLYYFDTNIPFQEVLDNTRRYFEKA